MGRNSKKSRPEGAANVPAKPEPATGTGRNRRTADPGPAQGTDSIRITVDLTRQDYQRMKKVVDDLARLSDIPTLPHSQMWRAVLRRLDRSPRLRAELADDIVADRDAPSDRPPGR
ncbi:hypothetical protein ACFO4E_21465 [Nocardiopsis mangrovi]|uniref:Uncharacterized protein n=1 Tax=Nocardiopsis mangrovi TaxID=1179818 RepID=A0ABV9E143_9ACTN